MTYEGTVVLEGVTKRHGRGPQTVTAVQDVSLHVREGDFLSIIGASGSGKSTLLGLIAGLDVPDAGSVRIGGRDLARLSERGRSDLRLRHVGFVFQSFHLFPSFTVEENVSWPLEFLGVGRRDAAARAGAALEKVGIVNGAKQRRPAELSGGEQQRVAIARALVTEPRLLLADEPTGNLDSATGQLVLDLLHGLNRERRLTIVMVTHSSVAAGYGNRAIELSDGRVVRDGESSVV